MMSSTTTQTRRFLFQLLRSSWHPDTTCVVCIIMFFLILILYFDAAHLNHPLVAFIPSRFRISLCLSSSHTVGIIFYKSSCHTRMYTNSPRTNVIRSYPITAQNELLYLDGKHSRRSTSDIRKLFTL